MKISVNVDKIVVLGLEKNEKQYEVNLMEFFQIEESTTLLQKGLGQRKMMG